MFSRFIPKPSHFRLLAFVSSKQRSCPHSPLDPSFTSQIRPFSSNGKNNRGNGKDAPFSDFWDNSEENNVKFAPLFTEESKSLSGISGARSGANEDDSWMNEDDEGENVDVFEVGNEGLRVESGSRAGQEWETADGFKDWSVAEEENADQFGLEGSKEKMGSDDVGEIETKSQITIEYEALEREEKELTAVVKGPNRAFGDLIAASGITDEMLDNLICLKDFEGVKGLPPLREIEDMRLEKSGRKSPRYAMEQQKQEDLAKSRVRLVDENGRAYGTGRRKCSIARVWVMPGDGKFFINDKEFDAYFPMLDHRAALLRPFSETKTMGLWDVKCTVQGGGTSGQVGAIQLGISRALQNWEPGFRTVLRDGGYLTRDPRVVERKKPGKAKARKSFQWVKR
uniref:Ribosomal protein S5 domain 2-like superfamily protein n=1 Tax=Geranium incanum TaxID=1158081 RepID=A0A0G4ANE5_9ROSI|nr:ribosomal protein S5 domain 2-like superfamily protein [Geranium incanum]